MTEGVPQLKRILFIPTHPATIILAGAQLKRQSIRGRSGTIPRKNDLEGVLSPVWGQKNKLISAGDKKGRHKMSREEALANDRKVYDEAVAPSREAYHKAMAQAKKAYREAVRPTREAYRKAACLASKAYHKHVGLAGQA